MESKQEEMSKEMLFELTKGKDEDDGVQQQSAGNSPANKS